MKRDWTSNALLVSAAQEQCWNEQQLGQEVTEPEICFWTYKAPALVLGCGQRSHLAKLPDGHLPALVRQAGGGAVLVGPWMLSLSVLLPSDHPVALGGILHSYQCLGQSLARGLNESFGLQAQSLEFRHEKSSHWACFGGLSPWEVVVDGRKIIGMAQVRKTTGVLLTAGVLVDTPDWDLLCTAMGKPHEEAAVLLHQTTSVNAICDRKITVQDLVPALSQSIQNTIISNFQKETL